MDLFDSESGARLSKCGRYRYLLWRVWDRRLPVCVFVLLNPSTADAVDNDPTITRCSTRAAKLGMGGIRVINVFAWRATDPAELRRVEDPIGLENDAAILEALEGAGMVICGWGSGGKLMSRADAVLNLIKRAGVEAHALSVNADGTPGHPLYQPYERVPTRYRHAG